MENLLQQYARAKRAQYVCLAAILLTALGLLEFVMQPFTWLHGTPHIPLTNYEGKALLAMLTVGASAGFGLNIISFKVMWPLEAKIYAAVVTEESRVKIQSMVDAETELYEARLEWLRKKAVFAEKRRRTRRGLR